MSSLVTLYAWIWAAMLTAGPVACVYGLTKSPTSLPRRRAVGIAMLGLLLSAFLVFSLSVTTLIPVAAAILPAPFIFSGGCFSAIHSYSEGPTGLPDFVYGRR